MWIKVKCYQREEFAIVGFGSEGKHCIAALHLARKGRGKGAWNYVGKVGTGFSGKASLELRKKLDELPVERPVVAFSNRRPTTVAVKPSLIAKVEYRALTADGQLRHASFKGMS